MPKNIALPSVDAITEAYIRFSRDYGWASGCPDIAHGTDGLKVISRLEGDWHYIDAWRDGVFPDKRAFDGKTRLLYRAAYEVFTMSYHGSFDAVATRMVKRALRYQYNLGGFCGGRGPKRYEWRSLSYIQRLVESSNSIAGFSGHEAVYGIRGQRHGYCFTSGGLLTPDA